MGERISKGLGNGSLEPKASATGCPCAGDPGVPVLCLIMVQVPEDGEVNGAIPNEAEALRTWAAAGASPGMPVKPESPELQCPGR